MRFQTMTYISIAYSIGSMPWSKFLVETSSKSLIPSQIENAHGFTTTVETTSGPFY